MPQFRQLTQEEVEQTRSKTKRNGNERRQIAEAYRNNLTQYGPGDWVEVTLDDGEKRDTVKLRLKRAATDLGFKLDFKRTRGDRLRFQVNPA
jgi:hypothetical protein